MARDPKVRQAFEAARRLGIPDEETKQILKKLLKLYDKKWEFIEENNYQTLFDVYFDSKSDKITSSSGANNVKEEDDLERPVKRIHLGEQSPKSQGLGRISRPLTNSGTNTSEVSCCKSDANVTTLNNGQSAKGNSPENFKIVIDIAKGTENVEVFLVSDDRSDPLPRFNYIPHNIVYQNAHVQVSLARIADEDCCASCSRNCLSLTLPCACARETGGEFAYTPLGQLKDSFLDSCIEMKVNPRVEHHFYCTDCPIERFKNDVKPEKCKGHLLRKFIKECGRKCGCHMRCGNRIVQRGITCNLQVFLTKEKKGWGVRSTNDLPKGTFVCEYVGEIVTNMELYDRILKRGRNEKHTYPVMLDADWGSEGVLKDEDALCLDATYHGNVARFINHRCHDANLIDIPVEVETPDRHYYRLAFFTTREVKAYEELTWDYGIDFDDSEHPVKAFKCHCRSPMCRDT
ncbi:hypothetical protein MLD38_010761 [Melastoma candidum]|uniref:Uncharacterized protein n=1 Tax=Melastoma candidum TaxID=119954 RepID=A0ACB9R4E0_9MYRT|nr:hypothetical protein MLD38_010761 [Melastoma candidum]